MTYAKARILRASRSVAAHLVPRRFIACLVLALTVSASYPCLAFNIKFLELDPIADFNDEDIDMMLDALDHTLKTGADGAEVEWKNDKTGNHGSITPLNSITQDGRDCRPTLIRSFSRTFSDSAQYLFCKDDDGSWRVVN